MSKKTKRTIDDVKNEVREAIGDEYIVLSDKYKNCHEKIRFRHSVCGHEYEASLHNIITLKTRCPYCFGAIKRTPEEFRNKFDKIQGGKMRLLEDYTTTNNRIKVECCVCGNVWSANPSNLLNGSHCPVCVSKEAGVRHRKTDENFKAEVYKYYGDTLTVLGTYQRATEMIDVRCNICGNVFSNYAGSFCVRHVACPICKMYKGERKIYDYLINHGILFERQKMFPELLGIRGGQLSYDFYVPDYNLLIEYQGNFHDGTANYDKSFYFETQQEHDKRKREYARDNKIELLEIWHYDFDNIDTILHEKLNT